MSSGRELNLEALIDKAGRSAVFDRASALGWTGMDAPTWVWQNICLELLQEQNAAGFTERNEKREEWMANSNADAWAMELARSAWNAGWQAAMASKSKHS